MTAFTIITGANCLGELLKNNHSLQELDIRSNPIGDEGMSSIASGLACSNMCTCTLIKLNVSACELSEKGTVFYDRYVLVSLVY